MAYEIKTTTNGVFVNETSSTAEIPEELASLGVKIISSQKGYFVENIGEAGALIAYLSTPIDTE